MNNLTVSRTSLGLVPLVAAVTGSTGAVIDANGWDPGAVDPVNEYAESADLNGASLARFRLPLANATISMKLYAASEAAARVLHAQWVAALTQPSFTITESWTGGSIVYDCCPARVAPLLSGVLLRQGCIPLTASIPRQP